MLLSKPHGSWRRRPSSPTFASRRLAMAFRTALLSSVSNTSMVASAVNSPEECARYSGNFSIPTILLPMPQSNRHTDECQLHNIITASCTYAKLFVYMMSGSTTDHFSKRRSPHRTGRRLLRRARPGRWCVDFSVLEGRDHPLSLLNCEGAERPCPQYVPKSLKLEPSGWIEW